MIASRVRKTNGCSVIVLFRGGHLTINPEPTEILDPRDEIVLIGTTEAEKNFMARYPEKK